MSVEDSLIRRLIFIQRFAGSEAKKAEEILTRIAGTVQARLLREPTEFQVGRLKTLRDDISNLLGVGFSELSEGQIESILAFSADEAEFAQAAMQLETQVVLSTPAIGQIEAAVLGAGMDAPVGPSQITIREALTQFAGKKTLEINNVINDGILLGDTTPEIAKAVGDFVDGKPKAQVNSLVRTMINNAGSQARKVVSNQNADILKGDEWVATLDSRTTLICGGRDGTIYPVGKGPFPPAHWNACCEDVLITTDRGQVPIQDVKVGDYAMTHTGEFKRVYAVMAKPHNGKIIELINNFGQSVRLTNDHPILTSIGYRLAGKVPGVVAKRVFLCDTFNYAHKFKRFKHGVFGSLVKQAVLLDSHNIITQVSEDLVTYKVGSFTTGVSSSIKLDKDVADNKVCDILTRIILMLKRHTMTVKKIYHKLFVKCGICLKGFS